LFFIEILCASFVFSVACWFVAACFLDLSQIDDEFSVGSSGPLRIAEDG
jgi:hypothetical protein